MSETPSLEYLDQFVFCGLCFKQMKLKGEIFFCPSGCFKELNGHALEELLWNEMGKVLTIPSYRSAVRQHMAEKLTSQQVRHLFEDLKGFVEFLPVEEKLKFASALVEKVDILSTDSVKIHFRL